MPSVEIIKAAFNYGLGIVLALFIAIVGYYILMFVLKENSKREERLAGIIENDITKVNNTIEKVSQYHREEHNKMIQTLTEIHATLKAK